MQDPEEIGAFLATKFQGWHTSNQNALGRTLEAWALKNSDLGRLIESQLKQVKDVCCDDKPGEVTVMSKVSGCYTPAYINLRGGSHYCATTTCSVKGYFVPTAKYLRARTIVCAKLRAAKKYYAGARKPPEPGSVGGNMTGDSTDELPDIVWSESISPTYCRAIELAKKIEESTNAGWRDPRSRSAVATQFETTVTELLYAQPP